MIQALIDLSVRNLHPPFYSLAVINLALQQVTAIDSVHVETGNYFVVETKDLSTTSSVDRGSLVGCGGWSHRTTLYGKNDQHTSRDPALLNPSTDAAIIRAVFFHPDWTRRGVASILLRACEEAAKEAGFKRVELRASLQALMFYKSFGYKEVGEIDRELGGGEVLALVRMERRLT